MNIPEHFSWPPHFKVAKIIEACLPMFECEEVGEGREKSFIFKNAGQLVLEIDESGWKYGFEARNGTWKSFLEGSYESISEYILRPIVDLDIPVLKPPKHFDFENPPQLTKVMVKRKPRSF